MKNWFFRYRGAAEVTPEDDRPAPETMSELDDIPFERLFEVWRTGGDLKAWNDRFGMISSRRWRHGFAVDSATRSWPRAPPGRPWPRCSDGCAKATPTASSTGSTGRVRSKATSSCWRTQGLEEAEGPMGAAGRVRRDLSRSNPVPPDDSEDDPALIRDAIRVEMKVQLQPHARSDESAPGNTTPAGHVRAHVSIDVRDRTLDRCRDRPASRGDREDRPTGPPTGGTALARVGGRWAAGGSRPGGGAAASSRPDTPPWDSHAP